MFGPVVGHDDIKAFLRKALAAEKPVHVLLEGPPASAKTLFLMELGRLPQAYFVVAGTASRAGLAELLVTWRPRILLIDEVETIPRLRDYAVLLHLMENEEVVVTKHGKRLRIPLTTWVFAAGNDTSRLPRALVSRFGGKEAVLRFRAYRSEEFVAIATRVLVEREGTAEAFAVGVANATLDLGSKDVRLAVRLARVAKDAASLRDVVETIRRHR